MPEQPATPQLKDLVLRHEKKAQDSNSTERDPVPKPKAKLRDSFILQQEEDHKTSALEEFNSSQKGLSLRSIIQKHENIAQTGGTVRREMASSTTVVSSKSTVSSDGSVSLSRDVIQGELSSKNGEEPVGKVTRTEYTYKSPRLEDNEKAVSKVTTTTTQIGNRRLSGPKITEVEDDDNSKKKIKSNSNRRSSLEQNESEESVQKKTFSSRRSSNQKEETEVVSKSSSSTRRYSGQKITDDFENEDNYVDESAKNKVYGGKSVTSSAVTSNIRRFSGPKITDDVNDAEDVIERKSSSRVSSVTTTSTTKRSDGAQTRSKTPNSVTRQFSKDEDETQGTEEKKKGLTRGDSVRALQHKFQQATETAASQGQKSFPRAGLILRTSSFNTADEQATLSSKQKQAAIDKNRHSPEKLSSTARNQTESTVSRSSRVSETRDSGATLGSNRTTTTSRVTETSATTNGSGSFLDNNTRVTGVQDILNRMRNADLVVESDDTCEDTEARALLNKFLGASVILQGMEQGMKAAGQNTETDITPGSAALVSRVEKQRVATTTQKQEEDIDNIWDEKQLRILLEACSDYEGRRQIRARLRTVMAEHKACTDVMAVAGQDRGSSTLSQESCETKQVTTKGEGSTVTRTEVHTRTVSSSNRLTKANSVASPFAKFKQLERQNSVPSSGSTPLFKFTDPKLVRSASTIKERLLNWVQAQTKDYKNIQIDNFSTSWSNGLAFCALIHHFCPDAFDYDKLTPDQRRHNFELAFRVAEEEAGIAPLLDVEDMVVMRRPDWKCVFTYVQSIYRRYHSTPEAVRY